MRGKDAILRNNDDLPGEKKINQLSFQFAQQHQHKLFDQQDTCLHCTVRAIHLLTVIQTTLLLTQLNVTNSLMIAVQSWLTWTWLADEM